MTSNLNLSVNVCVKGLRKSKQTAASSWISAREWRLGEKIGSGSFGDVFMGLNNKVLGVLYYIINNFSLVVKFVETS